MFAAVQPWIWSFYTACMVLAFLILFLQKAGGQGWQNNEGRVWHPPGKFIFTVGLFFAITLFQSLPLPESFLSLLSPFRFKILAQSRAIIGIPADLATLSYAPLTSLAWWIFFLGLFLFFLVFRKTVVSDRNLKILIRILLGVAFLEAIYGIIQALVPSLGVLWVDYITAYLGDARGTYINRNHFAGFMEMMMPLGLAYTLAMGSWHKKISFKALISSDRPNFQFLSLHWTHCHGFGPFVVQIQGRHFRRGDRFFNLCIAHAFIQRRTAPEFLGDNICHCRYGLFLQS